MDVKIGKDITFACDIAALEKHDAVKAYVWYIGLRNILMDSHSSETADKHPDTPEGKAKCKELSLALVTKKYEAMIAGEARSVKSERVSAFDPMARLRAALLDVMSKEDRKALAKLDGDTRAKYLADTIAANTDLLEARAVKMEADALAKAADVASVAKGLNLVKIGLAK